VLYVLRPCSSDTKPSANTPATSRESPALRLHAAQQAPVLHNADAWPGVQAAGRAALQTGWDVIIVRDGKIARSYVFLDAMPQ